MLPPEINSQIKGNILTRQTTYAEVVLSNGKKYKIHYSGKEEYFFEENEFTGIELLTDHPILKDYKGKWATIHISSACSNSQLISDIKDQIVKSSHGWRQPEEYLNQDYDIAKLVQEGHGLLFSGPFELGKILTEILGKYSVSYTFKEKKKL